MFSSCSQHPKHVILVYHYNIPHFETVTMFHFWQKTPSGRMLSAPGIQKAQHTSRNPPISPATWSPNHQYLDAHPWNQRHPQENRIPITDTFWYQMQGEGWMLVSIAGCRSVPGKWTPNCGGNSSAIKSHTPTDHKGCWSAVCTNIWDTSC